MTRVTEYRGHGIYADATGPSMVYDCGTGRGFASVDECKLYLDAYTAVKHAMLKGLDAGQALHAFKDAVNDAGNERSTTSFRQALREFVRRWM